MTQVICPVCGEYMNKRLRMTKYTDNVLWVSRNYEEVFECKRDHGRKQE